MVFKYTRLVPILLIDIQFDSVIIKVSGSGYCCRLCLLTPGNAPGCTQSQFNAKHDRKHIASGLVVIRFLFISLYKLLPVQKG